MKTYTAVAARVRLGEIIQEVAITKSPAIITRKKKPTVAIISMNDYEQLMRLINDRTRGKAA